MHALGQGETRFEDIGMESHPDSPTSPARPLTPRMPGSLNADAEERSRSWLRTVLLSYGVVPDRTQYDTFMRIFFDDIHILYPFLHAPTVWKTYDFMWRRSLLISSEDLETGPETRLSVGIVFICIAIGRCTASSRAQGLDATHSAGWNIYSVATHLMRELLDLTSRSLPSLHDLQAFSLMVSLALQSIPSRLLNWCRWYISFD